MVQPGSSSSGGRTSTAFDPDAYFGYGESLDLRTRGRLSHELVMRVRSPEPTMYRAQAYDAYADGRWSSTDEDLTELRRLFDGSVAPPPPPEGSIVRGHEVIQTFYVERALPNIVFHAYQARQVYVPATTVQMDSSQSLRLPFTLEKDTIYSVISQVPDSTPADLRAAPPIAEGDPRFARYLTLPPTVSDRFRSLAQRITGPEPTNLDKVIAVQDWLHANKEYRLDISPDPPGRDPIDVFVFERTEGFCEQIATTMALMLRASGIPTRLVTGFGPGERNLFSGYWEVRNSDAHAWVEVFYPGFGWVAYDPTFGVPESSAANSTFMFSPLARLTRTALPTRLFGDAAGRVADILGPLGAAFALAAVVAGATTVAIRMGRRRRRIVRDGPRGRVVIAWLGFEAAAAARGCTRKPDETSRAFARRAAADLQLPRDDVEAFVGAFERGRYGADTPTAADIRRVEELGARLREGADRERPPVFGLR